VSHDRTPSLSAVSAKINVPIERGLLSRTGCSILRCGVHSAAGITKTDNGRPMSINVETIGGALMIQHHSEAKISARKVRTARSLVQILHEHHFILLFVVNQFVHGSLRQQQSETTWA
jgi:hypothetical protein